VLWEYLACGTGAPGTEAGSRRDEAMETGFPQADARDDFDRARRRANWARLAGWLRGRPVTRLEVLGEVAIARCLSRAGCDALVPIGRIVGSVEPSLHFDASFRPTSQLPRARFERIAAGVRRGDGSDPVELYRCGDRYFVNDGHHRIAVARALGQREVWAEVTDVRGARTSHA
jgi:hypothetical protein